MLSVRYLVRVAVIFILFMGMMACGGSENSPSDTGDSPPNDPPAGGSQTNTTKQISQFGISWDFDRDVSSGQFANGDYWVVGPVTITGIDPASTDVDGRIINGTMINPSPRDGGTQGYDSAMYAGYGPNFDPAMNAARPNGQDLSPGNPLSVPPGSSLISTISVPDAGARPQLKCAAVLTVLDSVPAPGSFRPAYCSTDKTVQFNKEDLQYTRLASLPGVAGTPTLAEVERYFERPWIDHVPGWTARFQHPEENMPDYGREMSDHVGVGALLLLLDFTLQEKETLLLRYVQLGIDLYGIAMDGGETAWAPNGGHASGRKWPILFAGLMLDDTRMQTIGPGDGSGQVLFGEDSQTFYVSQEDVDRTHDPDDRAPAMEYDQTDLGLPEWGIRHATDPARDNKHWEATYRLCCTGVAWSGFVLAARIMDATTLWDHEALFDYQDRYMQVTASDGAHPGWRSWNDFSARMWDTYRSEYGPLVDY